MLGSVIGDNSKIYEQRNKFKNITLLACGYRGGHVSSKSFDRVKFAGCRGPLTSSVLRDAGISNVNVVGDPAILLPLILPRDRHNSGQKILVPHILDPKRDDYRAVDFGCSSVMSPETFHMFDLKQKLRRLSAADFVLAGAMHAAIVAQAYGVPFAFFSDGYIDCPDKWLDWALNIGLCEKDVIFHSDAASGKKWHDSVCARIQTGKLLPLLREAARLGPIKPNIWRKAAVFDINIGSSRSVGKQVFEGGPSSILVQKQ